MSYLLDTAAIAGAAVVVGQAVPAVASWPLLRRHVSPGMAGMGTPHHVALTFDDGPHHLATPRLLDILAAHDLQATFFMLGSEIDRRPALAREVAAAGHEIALHGYAHRCLIARTPNGTFTDLRRGYDTITDVLGEAPRWWRPPYGVLTTAALVASRRLNMQPMLWTAWGRDWTATATPESVLATVSRSLRGGGTVLLHDSDVTAAPECWRSMLGAVPRLIDRCRQAGWSIGPLSEHGHVGVTSA